MANRPRIPIPFGQGLDRGTGSLVVSPGSMADLRNVYVLDGRLQARRGFGAAVALDGSTHVVAGHALRSEGIGIVVGWDEDTGDVKVYRVEPDGSAQELLGTWFNSPDTYPVVHLAESFGRMFLAHDEARITQRSPTLVYDTLGGVDVLSELTGEFEGDEHTIAFRGVVSHLDYLMGWGYGSPSEDRPELVRSSLPGQPRTFNPKHYWIVGDRRDPVLRCVPGASDLIAFKGAEWHAITGYDRSNFGSIRRDPLHGLISSRLAINVSGIVPFWSEDGPRITDGSSPAESIEIPLNLQGFQPDDLPVASELRDAFACYVPRDRVVLFVFGRLIYALTVRVQGDWKWSIWTFPADPIPAPTCAFTLFETDSGRIRGAPAGYPEFTDSDDAGTFSDIEITNVNQEGDETIEVWLKETGSPDDYALAKSTLVSIQVTQIVRVTGLEPATIYDVSLRYRRGTFVHDAYSLDPASWPVVSQGVIETTIDPPEVGEFQSKIPAWIASPGDGVPVWQRTAADAQQLNFRIFPGSDVAGHEIELWRIDGVDPPALLATLVEGVDFDLGALDADGGFLYEDLDPTQAMTLGYLARSVNGMVESPFSAILGLWAGPQPEGEKLRRNTPNYGYSYFEGFLLASNRMSYHSTIGDHLVVIAAGSATNVFIRLFDNFDDAGPTLLADPTVDRGRTVERSGQESTTGDNQKPPTFGADIGVSTGLSVGLPPTTALANPIPTSGTLIIAYRHEIDWTVWMVTDVGPLIQRGVALSG